MRLKEKNLLKKFAATLKKFSAQGAKKVEYGTLSHIARQMGGWTGAYTSFSTAFKSYQDNGRLIMKGSVCAVKQHGIARNRSITLKAPITTAADNIYKYFFIVFQRK